MKIQPRVEPDVSVDSEHSRDERITIRVQQALQQLQDPARVHLLHVDVVDCSGRGMVVLVGLGGEKRGVVNVRLGSLIPMCSVDSGFE